MAMRGQTHGGVISILAFSWFLATLHAQSFLSFPGYEARWKLHYKYSKTYAFTSYNLDLWVGFSVAGDTLMNGYQWAVIRDYAHYSRNSNNDPDDYLGKTAYIRTDSLNQIAYLFVNDSTEIVTYRISQQLQDSFGIENAFPFCLFDNYHFWVDDCYSGQIDTIDTIFLGGVSRKRIYSPCMGNSPTDEKVVEGMGLIGSYYAAVDAGPQYHYDYELYQYCENGISIYEDTAKTNIWISQGVPILPDCNTIVANSGDFTSIHITLYPNPGQNSCRLDLPSGLNCDLEVYSSDGKCISKSEKIPQHWEFHAENLPAGLYFFRLSMNGETIRNIKWIKH